MLRTCCMLLLGEEWILVGPGTDRIFTGENTSCAVVFVLEFVNLKDMENSYLQYWVVMQVHVTLFNCCTLPYQMHFNQLEELEGNSNSNLRKFYVHSTQTWLQEIQKNHYASKTWILSNKKPRAPSQSAFCANKNHKLYINTKLSRHDLHQQHHTPWRWTRTEGQWIWAFLTMTVRIKVEECFNEYAHQCNHHLTGDKFKGMIQ